MRIGTGVMAVCLALSCGLAVAGERSQSISFVNENDAFFSGTDRNYTQGLKAAYTWSEAGTPEFAKRLSEDWFGPSDDAVFTASIGQSIFTPEDISVSAPLPDQHPYAGWLYAGLTLAAYRDDGEGALISDLAGFEIGVVGPSALGEPVQREFHKLIDGQDPLGWDNQLRDEPGFHLFYDRRWRAVDWGGKKGGFGFEAWPAVGASLGNVLTEARLGLGLRVGQDLASDPYGPPRIRPSLAGGAALPGPGAFAWYFFANATGRAVGQNIFLDGNTFRDTTPSVQRVPLVGELQLGLAVHIGSVRASYSVVTRTEEFDGQDDAQRFGAVSLTVGF